MRRTTNLSNAGINGRLSLFNFILVRSKYIAARRALWFWSGLSFISCQIAQKKGQFLPFLVKVAETEKKPDLGVLQQLGERRDRSVITPAQVSQASNLSKNLNQAPENVETQTPP